MNYFFLSSVLTILFLTTILLHMARKNASAIMLYQTQSLVIAVMLFMSFYETRSLALFIVALITLIIKVFVAPQFFNALIKKQVLALSASTYLNTPLTVTALAALTAIAHADVFAPLAFLFPLNESLLSLMLAAIFVSFFLIINRKGAISQMLGILSLENCIVAFAFLAGLEQSPSLQIGILFVIFIWLSIATIFVSMMYKHFGTLDVTTMAHLKD